MFLALSSFVIVTLVVNVSRVHMRSYTERDVVIASPSVCPSAGFLSVTLQYGVKSAKHIVEIISQPDSQSL